MIKRFMEKELRAMSRKFPVLAILGPRQSGKTTLARSVFKSYKYISLEEFEIRREAKDDPRLFLESFEKENGVILDEIQNAPELLSYIQTIVDEKERLGFFILTGSHNFLINQAVTQTLAGRVSIHTLLPLSINELKKAKLLPELPEEVLFKGFYPRVYKYNLKPAEWYPDYITTYIERDVRQITKVKDLGLFQLCLKLCAGRIGQLLNVVSLSNDVGVSVNTIKQWLSILQQSYIIFLLQPYYKNFRKRLVKSPKIYFYDTGLASFLLGIKNQDQLYSHYMRGGLFESMVISQIYKQQFNTNEYFANYFWRDKTGHEIDCIIEEGLKIKAIEVKSGKTVNNSFFDGFRFWNQLARKEETESFVIYAGDRNHKRKHANVLNWKSIDKVFS